MKWRSLGNAVCIIYVSNRLMSNFPSSVIIGLAWASGLGIQPTQSSVRASDFAMKAICETVSRGLLSASVPM